MHNQLYTSNSETWKVLSPCEKSTFQLLETKSKEKGGEEIFNFKAANKVMLQCSKKHLYRYI